MPPILQAIEDAPPEDWPDEDPYRFPRRPDRPLAGSREALKRPDRDPAKAVFFSRPGIPHTTSWEQMEKPGSSRRPVATQRTTPPLADHPVLRWEDAMRHGLPMVIREEDQAGEVLSANWPSRQRRGAVRVSATDTLHGADEVRFRMVGTRVMAVVRRDALSLLVTLATGESGDRPARFTSAGDTLPLSFKAEIRTLLRDAGLLTDRAWRFAAALERFRDIERRIGAHLAIAWQASERRAWNDVHAEIAAANDLAADLRHPQMAVRFGPAVALDPELYTGANRPPVRRHDADGLAKAILAKLAHATRKLQPCPTVGTEEVHPLAAE